MTCSLALVGLGRADDEASQLAFFESKIRPVLIEYCLDCHSAETEASGGLLLDSKQGWQAGGDSGEAVKPGEPAASRLWRAVAYDDPHLQMPPDEKLPAATVEDFKQWIASGAFDPRSATAGQPTNSKVATSLPVDRAEEHWSYRQIHAQHLSATPSHFSIDAFIDEQLRDADIAAAPEVNRSALARRLYFDLTGLPPTPEQLSEFIVDDSPDALPRLVDRLLASPRFGETFARRWMDVVRYGDSITLRGFVLPQAWRYRDYLINAFSSDRSFATMIHEQIAGDLMHSEGTAERANQLVATAFWAIGNTNLEQQDKTQLEMDYIDEQLEVLGRAFLGQTLGCARCHDHKFDPIPTSDYYAIAGILRSTVGMDHDNVSKWIEQPLPLDKAEAARFFDLESERTALVDQIAGLKRTQTAAASSKNHLIPVDELPGVIVDSNQAKLVGQWVTSTSVGPIVGESYLHDDNSAKGEKSATFEPDALAPGEYELFFAYSTGANRATNVDVTVFSADGERKVIVNQRQAPSAGVPWISLGKYRFEKDGQAFVLVSNANTDGYTIVDAVQFLPTESVKENGVRQNVSSARATSSIFAVVDEASKRFAQEAQQLQELETRLKALDRELGTRPRYLTIVERNEPKNIRIHIRGDVHNLGDEVPRGFLTALKHAPANLQPESQARLQLAHWIGSDRNPLTARVYTNRVWGWLMGQGLVTTVDNFGTTGSAPSHPQLLDWLALNFVAKGWSTKQLVREIVLSRAYRRAQVSPSENALKQDPDNRLLWRGHSRRISVEAMRDAMLTVSGELDLEVGGSLIPGDLSTDYNYVHSKPRRSVYQPVFRNSLPQLYEVFDFPNSSIATGQRSRGTVATQALVLMNHPWVIERASQAAKRFTDLCDFDPALNSPDALVQRLCVECFGRSATAAEIEIGSQYLVENVGENHVQKAERLQQFIQTLFASLDFRFLD